MRTIYEATSYPAKRDFDDEIEARKFVEDRGKGRVVTFVRGYDGKDRSAAMSVYENGAWKGVEIHQGGF